MAVIHDVMPAFELFQPATVDDTMRLLGQYREDAWVMAGGLDTFDWLKDRIKRPKVVVDLSQVKELSGIREADGGLEIGATTTLTEVVRHPVIREKYSILSTGAEAAASPQIRNQGTLGGNVSQDTRCWYYRAGWPCYRAGGNTCFADTPTAINREHAILGADRCVAVNPSDSAPALIALDAKFVIRTPKGERIVNAEDYFIGPGTNITRMNVASAMVITDGKIERIRLAVNAAAARPLRLVAVEDAVRGKEPNAATGEMAGRLAVEGARPLRFNGYKIPLMRNLVKRAIGGVEKAAWA